MILTEVYVPSLDTSYDFKLNENVLTAVIIEEIQTIICQKEQCKIRGDKNNFLLFKADSRQILSVNLSLYENGVKSGDKLIFA